MFSDTLLGRGRFLRDDFGWLVKELPVFGGRVCPFRGRPCPQILHWRARSAPPVGLRARVRVRARACACACAWTSNVEVHRRAKSFYQHELLIFASKICLDNKTPQLEYIGIIEGGDRSKFCLEESTG